jgi:NAD(P)-dependent dehydrogenase (short-subunit alcohol dehydrogenase family)
MSAPLSGSVAVITGASRGLGAGLATTLAGAGLRLGLCARNQPPAPPGAEVVTRAVDVTDAEQVDRFAAEVVGRFGRIDLWINNAGVLDPIGPLADADPGALAHHMAVNVDGVLFGTGAFARHVRQRPGGGVLVNVSSGAARSPIEGWAAYCASKAAVDMLTAVVALEGRPDGLRAYSLSPGLIDTDMQALIRSTSVETFPSVERFHRAHQQGSFNSPDWVAQYLLSLLEGDEPADGDDDVRVRVPDQPRSD